MKTMSDIFRNTNLKIVLLVVIIIQFTIIVFNYNTNQHFRVIQKKHHYHKKVAYNSSNKLLNLNDFYYTINNDVCSFEDVYLIIIIHSAPQNFVFRNVIRYTWGFPGIICDKKIKLVFLLGLTNNNELQLKIHQENNMHHDLVQGNFKDAYKNLTYKNVMGFKWVTQFCSQSYFVLKSDDDIFIEIFQLFKYLEDEFPTKPEKLVTCSVFTGGAVIRHPLNKYYISKEEYPNDTFTPYCSGWAYILTPDSAELLYLEANKHNFIWLDDVHIMGTILHEVGLEQKDISNFYTLSQNLLQQWVLSSNSNFLPYIVSSTVGEHQLTKELWLKTASLWKMHKKNLCTNAKTKISVNQLFGF